MEITLRDNDIKLSVKAEDTCINASGTPIEQIKNIDDLVSYANLLANTLSMLGIEYNEDYKEFFVEEDCDIVGPCYAHCGAPC